MLVSLSGGYTAFSIYAPSDYTSRTVKEEFSTVAFRKTFYEIVAQLQAGLDRYLEFYNRERPHQSYRTKGRTLHLAFMDGVEALPREEVPPQAA